MPERARPEWAVVLDFDGTITLRDVSDSVLLRYGGLRGRDIRDSYRPEVVTEEWVREMFLRVRCPMEELRSFVLRAGRPRPGFKDFVRWCARAGVPVEIVSGGVDFYLDLLLRRWGVRNLRRYCGLSRRTDKGIVVRYPFLKGRALNDFKRDRVLAHRRKGRRVLFAGDGPSDLLAAREADAVFAAGGLWSLMRRDGLAARRLRSFDGLRRRLEEPCSRH